MICIGKTKCTSEKGLFQVLEDKNLYQSNFKYFTVNFYIFLAKYINNCLK